jgi:hypothetical protein
LRFDEGVEAVLSQQLIQPTIEGMTRRPSAIENGQQAGVGLDQIRAFSRHRTLATMMICRDEHDRAAVQRTLADVVANTLTGAHEGRA